MSINLEDGATIKGKWWNLENVDHKCNGELSYNIIGGIQLQVFGSFFGTNEIHKIKTNLIIETLVGISQTGECLTLINALGGESGSSNFIESKYTIEYAVVSKTHNLTPATDLFDLIAVNLNCSETFFSKLYTPFLPEFYDINTESHKYKFEHTPQKELLKNDLIEMFLFFNHSFQLSHVAEHDFIFSQKVYLNTVFQVPLSFTDSMQYAQNIKGIFSFFTAFKIFFNNLQLREKESGEMFTVILNQQNGNKKDRLGSHEISIRYDHFENEFKELLNWWLNNQDFVSHGLSLYFQLVNLKIESKAHSLLSIIFALETLHTTYFDHPPFTLEEYKEFKKFKESLQIDKKFLKRFNECISHFNSQSFANRIKDLMKRNESMLKDYIYDINDFVSKIKIQRNHYAHQHSEISDSLIKKEDLDYFIVMCKLIFDASFLSLIGISEISIKRIINTNFYYRHYKDKKPIIPDKNLGVNF